MTKRQQPQAQFPYYLVSLLKSPIYLLTRHSFVYFVESNKKGSFLDTGYIIKVSWGKSHKRKLIRNNY